MPASRAALNRTAAARTRSLLPDATPLIAAQQDGGILTLLLNRPERGNALSRPLVAALSAALSAAEGSLGVSAVILAGSGKSFCTGADVSEWQHATSGREIRAHAKATSELLEFPRRMSKPVIAAVHGYALGAGCGLAAVCDIVIADPAARLGYPEIRHGILPALVMPGLVRRVGEARAYILAASAKPVAAAEALAQGLVDEISAPGSAMDLARERARQLAAHHPEALGSLKSFVRDVAARPAAEAMKLAFRVNVELKTRRAASAAHTRRKR